MTPENITFKKVLPDDWEKFKTVRLYGLQTDARAFGRSFEEESKQDEQYWRERFSDPIRNYYIAELNGIPVATAGAKKLADDNWMLLAVYTLPEHRGKGISRGLIHHVIEEIKKTGASTASLMVNTKQEVAFGMYQKMGFEIIEIKKDYKMGDGQLHDEYYMEKNIDQNI